MAIHTHTSSEMSLVFTEPKNPKIAFNVQLEFALSQLVYKLVDPATFMPAFNQPGGSTQQFVDIAIKPEVDSLRATLEKLIKQIDSINYAEYIEEDLSPQPPQGDVK